MKKLSNKYTVYICLGVLTIILAVASTSYAYFSSTSTQKDTNIITTMSCIDVSFISESPSINLTATYPMSENEGMATMPFNFTLANNCDNYTEYYLVASIVDNPNNIPLSYVKVALNGDAIVPPITLSNLSLEDTPNELVKENISTTYKLANGAFINKEKTSYSFRMWLDADNSDVWVDETITGKTIAIKLAVIGVAKNQTTTTTTTVITTTTTTTTTEVDMTE